MAFIALVALLAACTAGSSAQGASSSLAYQASESCQANQVCTYKYAAEQQHFGGDQQQNIAVTAVVEVSCNSVGTYNDTRATEYCMKIRDTALAGVMFLESKQTRDQERYIDKLLADWFCFVQTVEGKVVTVSYDITDNLQAVNFKKAIAAAFQANFKGTEEEEEIDPQSKHISHYRYIPTNEDGAQKMHRSVTSEDVEEYQEENQAHNIHLTKDEDIEYRSGILYSSSGTTFVQVLTLPQGKQQQLADGEEPLSNPNMFAVNGSYTLDKMRCYTLSRSAATPKNKRNAKNLVETSLRATIDKRSIGRMHMEDLRQQLPSPSQVLKKLHQEPENIQLASKLQHLLYLEAHHGPLPGTSPALQEVLDYLEYVNQSQDVEDVQIRQTIYSLLAQEGSLKSQMALLHSLLHGSDDEKDSIITHIAFTNNAHLDFVTKLEDLLTKKTATTDSLLLAYGALAATASSSVQQRIVLFLKRRLVHKMGLNATESTIHLLHALGNTGSILSVNLLLDYLMHSNCSELQLASVGAMRKLTAHKSVQDAFVTILESHPQECLIEAIVKTLTTGQEHSQVMGIHISENTHLLNALVVSALEFSNNTHLHQLVHSYLQIVNTAESHRLEALFRQSASKRTKRDSTIDWNHSSSLYNLISPQSSRQRDVTTYPIHRAYLWGRKLGPSDINIQVAAGVFGGVESADIDNVKVFGKAVAKGSLFGRSATIAEASAEALFQNNRLRIKLYVEIIGNILLNREIPNFSSCCLNETIPLHRSQYRIISFTTSVYIYVTSLDFFAELNAYLDVNLHGELCVSGASADVYNPFHGRISLVSTVRVIPAGEASITFLAATRLGISIAGALNYKLEPIASAHTCTDTTSCGPTFQTCMDIYNSWPSTYVEIYAWYQIRSVKFCRGRLPWGGSFSYPCGFSWGSRQRWSPLSVRWNLGGSGRSQLWGECSSSVNPSMCAGPSTSSSTGGGRIVPPLDFSSLGSGQVNFSCPELPPLSNPAKNVHELRPQDIKVVMALGDSITAGFGMLGLRGGVREYRGQSWSIGGDPNAQTVATFLRFYTPNIVGASLGNKTLTNLEDPFVYEDSDALNVAVSGAEIPDLLNQATNLRNQLKELNETGVIDMENDWKLLTILIGGNDLCKSCCSVNTADDYEFHLRSILDEIRNNIPRVFVNLVPMGNLSELLYRLSAEKSEHCVDLRTIACTCAFVPGPAGDRFRQELDTLTVQYGERIREVAQNYTARGYDDFAVVVQPFISGVTAENLTIDFLSDLDYFHPSLVAHQQMAKSLWNSMLTPAARKKTYIDFTEPIVCPGSTTHLYTN